MILPLTEPVVRPPHGPGAWPQAAYVHIPFCQRRCDYCDFATGRGTAELIERYVTALVAQIQQLPAGGEALTTVFFGGGTPSLLTSAQIGRILSALAARVGIAEGAEISLEANPGTMTAADLQGWQAAGITRVSLGVQAFQDHLLAACGRGHGVQAVLDSVALVQAAGFASYSLDLMFGLPHQTLADWQDSLAAVQAIAPPHISLYDLTIEPGTKFGRIYQPGAAPLPTDEATVAMYELAIATLTAAGYGHYEIANFAQPGHTCRHNRVYWENRDYYGLGMGAVGYGQGQRYEQPKTLAAYFEQVSRHTWPQAPRTSQTDQLLDTLILGLRLREGVSLSELRQGFGDNCVATICDRLQSFRQQGWVTWDEDRLRLIPPEGWLFSNTVLVHLCEVVEQIPIPC